MNILFWDIDGTLVKTSKSGIYAFEQATCELWKQSVDFDKIEAAGMTDNYIAAQIIELITGRQASREEVAALTHRYEQLLAAQLYARGGKIMPSVRDILEYVEEQDDYLSLLLTGNSKTGADIKLKYFELDYYFNFEFSAFCDTYYSRIDIAKCGAAAVDKLQHAVGTHNVFVIGDTPNDINCGKAIGAYTIAVATGHYTLDELQACSPWWAVERLPQPAEFIEKLNTLNR